MVLQVSTWNVNGLKSIMLSKFRRRELIGLSEHSDLMVLSETWISSKEAGEARFQVPGFEHIHMCKPAQVGPGRPHAGISVFLRSHLLKWVTVVSREIDSGIMVLRLAPCLLPSLGKHSYMVCCYFTPTPRLDAAYCFDSLAATLGSLEPLSNAFVLGDMNARTGCMTDIVQKTVTPNVFLNDGEIGLSSWVVVPNPRNNQDPKTNEFGRSCVELCLGAGLAILNGRVAGEPQGVFTFCSQTGSGYSAPDVVLASEDVFALVKYMRVGKLEFWAHREKKKRLSDHAPVIINLSDMQGESRYTPPKQPHRRFCQALWPLFAAEVSTESTVSKLCKITDSLTSGSVGSSASMVAIADVLTDCEVKAFAIHSTPRKGVSLWWNIECEVARRVHRRKLKIASRSKDINCGNGLKREAHKEYYSFIRARQTVFRQEHLADMVRKLKYDPMVFWRELRGPKAPCPLSDLDRWAKHFEKVLSPATAGPTSGADADSFFQRLHGCVLWRECDTVLARKVRAGILNAPIGVQEVAHVLKGLYNNKAADLKGQVAEFAVGFLL